MLDQITIMLVALAWVCVGNVIYFVVRWYLNCKTLGKLVSKNYTSNGCIAVIESVKGTHKDFVHHVTQLINQDHPCFRIIFCLSDIQDPAYEFLVSFFNIDVSSSQTNAYHIKRQALLELDEIGPGLQSIEIVIAGHAKDCSQKVFNQICAYDLLLPEDRLLAWVDADAVLSKTWLRDLVHPIGNKKLAAVTGYRCLAPEGQDWASAFISVINSSILTLLGNPWRNSFWGGSMAMTRQVFDKFQIPESVKHSFSDDTLVSTLLKNNKIPIYFSYAVLPPNTIKYTFREMFSFGRRQYMYARFYYKFHIFIAVILLGGFTLAFLILVAKLFSGPSGFEILLFMGLTSAMAVRGIFRFIFIRYTLKTPEYGFKCLFLETLGTPLIHLLDLFICISAMVGNRVEWAGIAYKIKDPYNVKVL